MYRFPAEWEEHAASWLTWPHNAETWPRNLIAAQDEFDRLVRTLAEVENVSLLATGEQVSQLQKRFASQTKIRLIEIPTNDSWIRDYGPTFVKSLNDGTIAGIDWQYDGWGEKYPPFDRDQQVASAILAELDLPRYGSELILEGGSIDSNGCDTCLTTKRCLTTRNSGWTVGQMADELSTRLGLERVILLESHAIPGDDTDGHIDQVARFVTEKQVVISARHETLVRPTLLEHNFAVHVLPDPDEVSMYGMNLPASYTNFYIANELVVVPEFGVAQDIPAQKLLGELFPERQVTGLPSRHLTVGLGSFHCLTQQQPA